MKIVTMYEAQDGKLFRNESLCLEYEQRCVDLADANDMLHNGATLMDVLTKANQTRLSFYRHLSPQDKEFLITATKDTGIVVRHWQGSNRPGYKPCQVNDLGQILLHGDIGSWDGPYGNWVELKDLLRYAQETVCEHTS